MKMSPSCLPRRAGSKHLILDLDFFLIDRNFKLWSKARSGQGQVMVQVGQYAHLLKRRDEPSRLAPFACSYLLSVATYQRKTS